MRNYICLHQATPISAPRQTMGVFQIRRARVPAKYGYALGGLTGEWIICKLELSRKLQNYQLVARHFD
jgi:hypothetical protein